MEATATTTKKLNMEIWQDADYSSNPLTDWGNEITMLYTSSRYNLGTERVDDYAEEIMELLGYSEEYKERLMNRLSGSLTDREIFDYLVERMNKKGFVAIPVYAYIHSGIALSTTPFNDRFDSGLAALMYISKENYRNNWQVKRVDTKKVKTFLEGMMVTFNDYISGNVYGFSILDEDGDVADSCGGFLGDDYASQMTDHIDASEYGMTNEQLIEHIKTLGITY